MTDVLRLIGEILPWVAVSVSLLGGFLALAAARRRAFEGRGDRTAVRVAIALGVLAGACAGIVVAAIGAAWAPGGVDPLRFAVGATILGAPAFVVVTAASLTGAGVVGRITQGGAVAGAVIGPIVLGIAGLGAVALVQAADNMVATEVLDAEREAIRDRSQGIHVTIDDVAVTLDGAGLVSAVALELRLRSETDLPIEQLPGKLTYPLFVLQPGGAADVLGQLQAEAAVGSPANLDAGVEHRYAVAFDADALGAERRPPGTWLLEVRIGGADGLVYVVEATVDVIPRATSRSFGASDR